MSGSDGQSDDAVTVTDAVREVGDHPIVEVEPVSGMPSTAYCTCSSLGSRSGRSRCPGREG